MTQTESGTKEQTELPSESDPETDSKPPDLSSLKNDSPSGISMKGNWNEVADFCEMFTKMLEEKCQGWRGRSKKNGRVQQDLQEWKDWYPKRDDSEGKLEVKTASQAKFKPKKSTKKDFKKSASDFSSFQRDLKEKNPKKEVYSFRSGLQKGARAAFSTIGRWLGKLEEFIYRQVITKTNPFYFDSSLLSASLTKNKKPFNKEEKDYRLNIKIHDRKLRERVCKKHSD